MKILLALLALLVSAVASAQTREEQAKLLAGYMPYAGKPVDRFQFWRVIRFELVGEYKVIFWPTLDEAYLVTVRSPCYDLQWTRTIGFTSTQQTVDRNFDYVLAGVNQCRISEILPIDYKRYLEDRQAAEPDSKL